MMKKLMAVCMCGLMATALMTGCSKKASTTDSVKLGNYMGVEFTPAKAEVTDEDVEQEIQLMVNSNPTITEVKRAAKEGDIVNIDYEGLKDDVAFEGGTASDFDLTLGSGQFIEGFEDGLIGASKGQELSLNLTFPEQYQNEELAGQAVVFNVTVNAVKESTPAELTDEFIAANTDSKTVDEYREVLKGELIKSAEENAGLQNNFQVFQKVLDASEVTLADPTVEEYYESQLTNYEKQAEAAGIDLETMVGFYGTNLEDFKSELKGIARESATQSVVVKAIAEKEGFAVTDEELVELAEGFGYESKDNMFELVGENTAVNFVLTEKVVAFILENAVEV